MKGNDPKWMEKAFAKNKGKLHRETGTPMGKNIPASKLVNKPGMSTTRKRENNLAKIGKKYGGR